MSRGMDRRLPERSKTLVVHAWIALWVIFVGVPLLLIAAAYGGN